MKEARGTVEREPYKHGAIKLNDQELIEFVKYNPDLYLKDYAKRFNITPSGIWYAFKRLHITLKKSEKRPRTGAGCPYAIRIITKLNAPTGIGRSIRRGMSRWV